MSDEAQAQVKKAPELHELLAALSDRRKTADAVVSETKKIFRESNRFIEEARTYEPIDQNDLDIPETSFKAMTTTVGARLAYTKKALAPFIDIILQQESTNQVACEDIILYDDDGEIIETLAENVPVSALLQLENLFNRLGDEIYRGTPTIDTNVVWKKGENEHGDIYVQDPIVTVRTITETEWDKIDVNPKHESEKFKMELRERAIKKQVGHFTKLIKSGAISAAEKAEMLDRFERVKMGIKIARSRANKTPVVKRTIGAKLLNYIHGTK